MKKFVIDKVLAGESKITWCTSKSEFIETPKDMIEFLKELETLCRRYDLSISHEDGHGAFEFEEYSEGNMKWLCHGSYNKF
jgi:hypothetical protein